MQPIDPIVRTIANLIRMRGGSSIMTVTTTGEYNPATSTVETTVDEYEIKTLVFDAKESTIPGGLIKTGDKQVFVKADNTIPKPDQATGQIIFEGFPYKIIHVKELNTAGTGAIMYEIFVRR